MATAPVFSIQRIGSILPTVGGHLVSIGLETDTSQTVALTVPHETLPKLFHLLQAAGAEAARQRLAADSGNGGAVVVDPIHATRWTVGVGDRDLVVRFVTPLGVPLLVAISHSQSAILARDLLRKADQTSPHS